MLLAIDAGDIALIRDLLDELPTLKRVFDEGAFHPLQSTAEFASASI